ncbi:FAD-dependent oxidoreductase [Micromonospora sp. SH-82]|uniref:FAD-dependent oxidoreductase n=1 Tax=Micromonospora sp. SH-82 TaxID=3132938 RepID=UPI003EBC6383
MRVAVVGAGVVGLSTAVALLGQGADVVCYDRGRPMGERSVGGSRIFRLAHTDAELVDLAIRSRRMYDAWSRDAAEELIDDTETVVSGPDVSAWAAAMAAAGARHSVVGPTSPLLRLPAGEIPAQSVVDHAGGVVRAARVGAYLRSVTSSAVREATVFAVEETARGVLVRSSTSAEVFDAAVVCAGAATSGLAAQVGIYTPPDLNHHVRFTFALRRGSERERFQCWISRSSDGLDTYQHLSGPGEWAVGAHVGRDDVRWEAGRDHATQASRRVVTGYVRRYLTAVDPRVREVLHCTTTPGLDDGYRVLRRGRVLAVYGDNLFKLAPVLGRRLAGAALDGSTPPSTGMHRTTPDGRG